MKFIINTFDKTSMYKLAYELKGEVVNKNESLVIVEFDNEYDLQKKVESILENNVFIIHKKSFEDYNSKKDEAKEQAKAFLNFAQISRTLANDRSSITRDRVSDIHKYKIETLVNLVADWILTLPVK